MKNLIVIIARYFLKYRFAGVKIGCKLFFGYTDNIKVPKIRESIFLRKNTSDSKVFEQIFYDFEYDFEYFFEPKFIIDAGANIGLASVFFKNKFPNALIVAIEPEQTNFKILEKNLLHYSNIEIKQCAVSNKLESLFIVDSKFGEWGFTTSKENNSQKNNKERIVNTITINDIMGSYNLKTIDLLKIDIEGYEKELFESNIDWLPKTKCIIIELHDGIKRGCSKSVFDAIGKFNFSLYLKGENLIFFNNEL